MSRLPADVDDDPFALPEVEAPSPAAPAPPAATPYLDSLNEAQRRAVETTEGPVLVLAGAGTGKTRVLTSRLAHIINLRLARPWQILAVTFTNKAAREMKDRIEALVGFPVDNLWIGTFHAIGARILRRHAELVGLSSNFTILDADDQLRLVKQLLQAENIDDRRWPPRAMLGLIQRWKDRGLTPDRVPAEEAGEGAGGFGGELYRRYQERLATLNACDFGDLLLHCLTLFTENRDVLEEYRERFAYVLVDEYQDTNVAQYLWLRLLARRHGNICCVGDDDQSIYGWRGAEVGNILRFEKDFPGAKVIRLEENYRSSGHILAAASGLIAHNRGRLGKTLWTRRDAGEKVTVRGVWDGEEEARMIGEDIEALQRQRHPLGEIAILVRAGFQTREFEDRFLTLGLPYRVIGGPRFYERLEIRDAIAYLRVIAQPDDDLAFERIVNKPRRGIGAATLQAVHRLARDREIPLLRAARILVETDELTARARSALARILDDFERWRALAEAADHVEVAETVLDESGYVDMWRNDRSPEAPGRLENLKEFVTALEEFENLEGFLEHVSLVMENVGESGGDMVNLMTLHSAKGLEFDTVFLPGWEEGLFPHQRALDEGGAAALEEERRLAYVGLTRARVRARISFAASRRINNQWQNSVPSRFIAELPEADVEAAADLGLYAGRPAARGGGLGEVAPRRGFGGGPRYGPGRSRRPATIDAVAVERHEPPAGGYRTGARVFHQKFGYGRVVAVDGDRLEIDFDKAGTKKVMDSFVQPA